MQRKRGGLTSIEGIFSGLDGPVKKALQPSPQALRHFTLSDQVNQLASAREADAEMGFMARLMALCSLPRTNSDERLQYKRINGPYKLIMIAGGDNKLPYGNLPRLLLAWVSTEAVRTQSRELVLGDSLSEFMRKLGLAPVGGARTRLRNQMDRLFSASVELIYEDEHGKQFAASRIADRGGIMVEPQAARPALAMGEQNLSGRGVFQRDHRTPCPAGHERPEGPQAVPAGSGLVHVARLPDLCPQEPATALVEAVVPPVRGNPGQGGRQVYCPRLPPQGAARTRQRSRRLGRSSTTRRPKGR